MTSSADCHAISRTKQKILKRSADDAQSDYNADTEESVRRIGRKWFASSAIMPSKMALSW